MVVLVFYDEGVVEVLNFECVLILFEGIEDYWNLDYVEFISFV